MFSKAQNDTIDCFSERLLWRNDVIISLVPSLLFFLTDPSQKTKTNQKKHLMSVSRQKYSSFLRRPLIHKYSNQEVWRWVEEEIQGAGEIRHCGHPNPCSYCHKDNNNLINVSLTMLTLLYGIKKWKKSALTHCILMEPLNFFLEDRLRYIELFVFFFSCQLQKF